MSNANTFRRAQMLFEDGQTIELQNNALDQFITGRNERQQFRYGQQELVVFARVEDVQKALNALLVVLDEQFRFGIVDGHLQETIRDQG